MAMPERGTGISWVGRTVVDRDGAEIGVCSAVLTDDGTGVPEWLYARVDEALVIVPLVDAREDGEHVRVAVSSADVHSAPPPAGDTQHLSQDEEAALYRHYGIEYSRAASETLLPASTAADTPTPTAGAALRGTAPSGPARRTAAAAAGALAALGLLIAVVLRLRRRPEPSPASRGAAWTGQALRAAGRGARQATVAAGAGTAAAVRTATPVVSATGQALRTAGRGAHQATVAAGAGTAAAVRAAAPVVSATGRLAAAGLTLAAARGGDAVRTTGRAALEVGGAVRAVPEMVSESGHRLEKGWRRTMGRLSLGLGFGVGYVLGARAGRARFEQIKQAAVRVTERPQVQEALGKARDAAPGPLKGAVDGLAGRSAGAPTGTPRTTPGTVGLAPNSDIPAVVTTPTSSSLPAEPLAADDLSGDDPTGAGRS